MKVLHLVLKHKWYNMIESGEKREEYRDLTPYYDSRFNNKTYDSVCFHKGYTNQTMSIPIESITIGTGKTEWGAEEGKQYYVIKLGRK